MNASLPARLLALAVVAVALAPSANAQFFDRLKRAAQRTVQEAGAAARQSLVEEGMDEASRVMLAEGAFAGSASPWLDEDGYETVAMSDLAGQAYVAPDRLAFAGYDIARMLLDVLGERRSEEALPDLLRRAAPYAGLGHRIDFGRGNANQAMFILGFRDGRLVVVE